MLFIREGKPPLPSPPALLIIGCTCLKTELCWVQSSLWCALTQQRFYKCFPSASLFQHGNYVVAEGDPTRRIWATESPDNLAVFRNYSRNLLRCLVSFARLVVTSFDPGVNKYLNFYQCYRKISVGFFKVTPFPIASRHVCLCCCFSGASRSTSQTHRKTEKQ